MESHDYPLRHFELMIKLAGELKAIDAEMLEHNYNYESFGSWWFTIMLRGQRYRIVYDGKGYFLRIDQNAGEKFKEDWREMIEEPLVDRNDEQLVRQVLSLIGQL